ncbi:MAG: aspartate aminotransferase family protein [Alphaproteobacteria bacterium]|nr:aspartate aminotransferase family protein [Alphaproteobacteria bacterium]
MSQTASLGLGPNDLESYWMPFTANRQFKSRPRLIVAAKDMHLTTADGRKIIDGSAGMWCVNAGHCRETIVRAVQEQVARMDYSAPFQGGHPGQFEVGARLALMAPSKLNHLLFACSGSEAVDTALKVAIAYHRLRGEGTRTRLIGRERGYHGVGFGGTSVGGMVNNRKFFGPLLNGVDHLPHTYDRSKMAFSRGQPEWGGHLADALEGLVQLHDASTIAAVIVEPMAGSTGVLVPPKGYLERLRELCTTHGILLIFDEVITGFGRLGAGFAAERFGVVPDMMTVAKGLTNATVPMSAVFVRNDIYETFLAAAPENAIDLFHGYTYSGHPLATAAAKATLDLYQEERLFERARELEPYWENAIHGLRDCRHVVDIRNIGLVGAIELEPRPGKPTARAFDVFLKGFDRGLTFRITGDTVALSPPLIITRSQIDEIFGILREVINTVD